MNNATKLIELRKNQTQLLKDLASIDAQIFEIELKIELEKLGEL